MADPLVEAYVTNTAAHILGRDLNSAWDSAVSKFTAPKPAQRSVSRTVSLASTTDSHMAQYYRSDGAFQVGHRDIHQAFKHARTESLSDTA